MLTHGSLGLLLVIRSMKESLKLDHEDWIEIHFSALSNPLFEIHFSVLSNPQCRN